jgi:Tfp pilus assembly protein PilX
MRTQHTVHRQSGMVLIVSLIILLLLTIIGVSGLRTTNLEERMAGNDRDQSVAFQAAETALRAGEAQANALFVAENLTNFCDGTFEANTNQQGLYYSPNINDGTCLPCANNPKPAECTLPNPTNSATWTDDANSVPIPDAKLLAGTTARYYVTYHYFYRNKGSDKTIDSYYFTVTARGVGAKGGEVILRSYFGAKIDMGQI